MLIANRNDWNSLLDKARYPLQYLHSFAWYEFHNRYCKDKYPERYLWTDGNYIFSFYVRDNIAWGINNQACPFIPISDVYERFDPTDFKNMGVKAIKWISLDNMPTTYPFTVQRSPFTPRTCLTVMKSPEDFLAGLHKDSRYEVRKAIKRGYQLVDLNEWDCVKDVMPSHLSSQIRCGTQLSAGHFDEIGQVTKFRMLGDAFKKVDEHIFIGIRKDDKTYGYLSCILARPKSDPRNHASINNCFMTVKQNWKDGIGNLLFYGLYQKLYERGIKYNLSAYGWKGSHDFHLRVGYEIVPQTLYTVIL